MRSDARSTRELRRTFFDRLLSVDIVAPPMARTDFEEAFAPLFEEMRAAEAMDGRPRRVRLHVPSDDLRARLRTGEYGRPYLDLVARSFFDSPETVPLIGLKPPEDWRTEAPFPCFGIDWMDRADEDPLASGPGFVSQASLVHGKATRTRLVELLAGDAQAEADRVIGPEPHTREEHDERHIRTRRQPAEDQP